jgi:hypothetical protein
MENLTPKGLLTHVPVYALYIHHGEDANAVPIVFMTRDDGRPLECLFITDPDWASIENRNHFWPKLITIAHCGVVASEYERFKTLAERAVRDTMDVIIEEDLASMVTDAMKPE